MKISFAVYVVLLLALLLASCVTPEGEPWVLTGNQIKATQAELDRAEYESSNEFEVWDDYAMEVAKDFAMYMVEGNRFMDQYPDPTSSQYHLIMSELISILVEAREIPVPRGCTKCTDLNQALREAIAAQQWLDRNVDNTNISQQAWAARVDEMGAVMEHLEWAMER